jgi:hypothetical protein
MTKLSKPRKRIFLILISTLAAVFVAGALYLLVAGGSRPKNVIVPETPGWEQEVVLPPEPPAPEPELAPELREPSAPGQAKRPEAAPVSGQMPGPVQDPCKQASARISGFFSHLDARGYVNLYELQDGSEQHFIELLAKLFASPPVVVRETASLSTILKNTSHMYRVLGRSNVFLIKDIMEEESGLVETTMADFHHWSTVAPECRVDGKAISLPLVDLYDYAGYFLNTMGGQSYLFRRPPRIRTLTKYYSVLILDRANEQGINTYGIDIRPAIDSLLGEMEAIQNLKRQDEYLAVLQNLKLKYLAQYGGVR